MDFGNYYLPTLNSDLIVVTNKRYEKSKGGFTLSKKNKLILTVLCTLFIVAAIIFFNKDLLRRGMISQEEQKEQIEAIDLMFGNNYISFVNESNHGMTFNIFGIQKESTDNLTLEDIVSEISFNNENINVKRFQIDSGFEHKGFRLFNLIVQISVQGYDVEEADEITLTFHGDQQKVYHFGKMILKNSNEVPNNPLGPKGEYRVTYDEPDLSAPIENSGSESLTVNEIYDLGRNMTYHLGKEIILKRNAITEVEVTSVSVDSSYDFYTVTPILSYSKNAEKNEYIMPPVLYGAFLSDEKKIDRIIRK